MAFRGFGFRGKRSRDILGGNWGESQCPCDRTRDLFDYVKKEGSRGYDIQRYKGLGEMTAPQLWETTMDPERRTLLSVKLEDLPVTETIFATLIGRGRRSPPQVY